MKENNKYKILFIDDEPASLTAFKSVFRDDYDISLAGSADEGYEIMKNQSVDIVISDQRMPGITGVEFLHKVRVEFPETVRMLITGYSDIDAVIKSINGSMVSYYFSKPYNEKDMKAILDNTIERLKLSKENRTLLEKLQLLVEELRAKKDNLEQEILKRRTAESELQVAREKAEESSRMKSSLLLNLNHEFRTPMNAILGFSQIMKETIADEEFKGMAEMINTSGKRLLKTLNAIVELARSEADNLEPYIEGVDLSSLAKQVISEFHELADRKNIVIREDIQPDVIARFNKTFALLVLSSLLDNAIKFTHKGFIDVTISTETSDGEDFAVFMIRDTGIGIPLDYHEKVFEDFRQVSEGVGRYYEGLGIGLALCKKILHKLSGEILLESKTGEGTLFTVRVPVMRPKSDNSDLGVTGSNKTPSQAITKAPPAETNYVPLLLIVEDNDFNVELIEAFLQKSFRLVKAFNGETAIQLAKEKHFDLILMDINLGTGIDGVEAMLQIRKINGNASMPFIAVTGFSSMEDKKRLLSLGFNAFLPKPFTRQSLLSVVQESLK